MKRLRRRGAVKIALVGGRNVEDFSFVLDRFEEVLIKEGLHKYQVEIVSGGAKGVDSIAKKIASLYGIPFRKFPAEWDRYGKKAGPLRNSKIVESSDIVIAIPSPFSKGTWDTVRKAQKRRLKTYVFEHKCGGVKDGESV